jgi:hypothetical protein
MRQAAVTVGEEEKKSGASLERGLFCIGLSYLLNIVLAIYDKEVLLGFLPLEGFPG